MAAKSFYSALAPKLRAELDRRLIDTDFTDYDGHAQWLSEQGCLTSASAVKLYGRKYQKQMEAVKLQHDFRTAYGVETSECIQANAESLIAISQEIMLDIMRVLRVSAKTLTNESSLNEVSSLLFMANRAVSSIGTLNNSQVTHRKYLDEVRAKQEAKFDELAAEGQSKGIDEEFMRRMRVEVLGMGD